MVKFIDGLKQGLGIAFVLILFAFGIYLVKGWNGLQATDGDVLTAAKWNELVGSANGAPSGFVGAFNLATCPVGRKPADGNNGTPDLRGTFIRGIGGELNSRDVTRSLASYQTDAFQGHWHNVRGNTGWPTGSYGGQSGTSSSSVVDYGLVAYNVITDGVNGTPRIANETRPKNVALLYCIKE